MFTETEIDQFDSYLVAQVRRSLRSTLDLFSPWGRKKLSDADILPDFAGMARPVERKSKAVKASIKIPDAVEEKKAIVAESDEFEMLLESAGSLT